MLFTIRSVTFSFYRFIEGIAADPQEPKQRLIQRTGINVLPDRVRGFRQRPVDHPARPQRLYLQSGRMLHSDAMDKFATLPDIPMLSALKEADRRQMRQIVGRG
jgi:hypothetical protein